MAPGDARTEFTGRLRARGSAFPRVTVEAGFAEAFAFYRDVRPAGCDEDLDGDMLLFQLAEFQRYVTSSEAYRVALGQVPANVQLTYQAAG